jgi:hypothetical protein
MVDKGENPFSVGFRKELPLGIGLGYAIDSVLFG